MNLQFNPKDLSTANKLTTSNQILKLKNKWINPRLELFLIWDNHWAELYAKTKQKVWEILWVNVNINSFDTAVDTDIVRWLIWKYNRDQDNHWIIIENPIPEGMSYDELTGLITPDKDIDWLNPVNLWDILLNNHSWILPATPLAIIDILNNLVDEIRWLSVVIVWHWKTVWAPLSSILSNLGATVTVCTIDTKNTAFLCRNSDVIISATWIPWLITSDMVIENSIVIDAWIFEDENWKTVWDVDYDNVSKIAKYVTPVPWWVWPVTTSVIFQNLISAILKQKDISL